MTAYGIIGTYMTVVFITIIVATIYFVIRPQKLQKISRANFLTPRYKIFAMGVLTFFVAMITFGSLLSATKPESVKQSQTNQQQSSEQAKQETVKAAEAEAKAKAEEEAKKPVVQTETKTETIPFESKTEDDGSLAKGATTVATSGVDGTRTITYSVTLVQGKETERKVVKDEVTKQPVTQVTKVGTYVAPAPAPTTATQSQPTSTTRTGAICRDGWHSSATGSGACSHHGGVDHWLYN